MPPNKDPTEKTIYNIIILCKKENTPKRCPEAFNFNVHSHKEEGS